MARAQADRTESVRRDLRLHLNPAFGGLFELDIVAGRHLVKDWIRAMSGHEPLRSGSPFSAFDPAYEQSTVGDMLWILREVIAHAQVLGYDVPAYAKNLRAMKKKDAKPRKARHVDIATAAAIAAELHVIHQTAFWLMRVGGLRISEAYGLKLGDFIVDADGDAFLFVKDQGGRTFYSRDDEGGLVRSNRKQGTKTEAGNRLVALPGRLTQLLVRIVEIFHDTGGETDLDARLVPPIASVDGGQAGFRHALTQATRRLVGVDDTDDVLSEGAPGGGTTADPAPSAVPGQDPAEPAPSPPSTGPDTPEDQAATPPPSVPAPTAAPPQSEGGPEALGEDDGTPPEEEAAAPPPEDEGAEEDQGTDEDVAAPEAAPPPTDGDAAAGGSGGGGGGTSPQPATTPTIADTQVPLPDDEAVVAHFGSRPETEALLGLAEEEASERAAAHREAIGAAGPFADGSHPADCLSATAVGPGPDVVAAVESGRDADGQAVLAYLVVSGTPALDQARVVVADPDGCLSRIIPIPT